MYFLLLNFCEVACQTSATTISSVETQTDLCPVTKVHNLSAAPDDSPKDTLVNDPPAENDNSHSSNDETVTPNIPTSDRFNVPHVQEPSPSSDQSPPRPIPKPRKSIKPVPKPRRNKPVSKPTCIIEPPTQQQPSTPADRTKSASRTILIIGDSIPKHLVGRRMSKQYRIINRCIPGSTLELWTKLAPIFIAEECPTAVIIHCGTNNISSSLTTDALNLYETLVTIITSIQPQLQVIVSSLTLQKHYGHNIWICEFNARLYDLCNIAKWTLSQMIL